MDDPLFARGVLDALQEILDGDSPFDGPFDPCDAADVIRRLHEQGITFCPLLPEQA